MSDKLFPEEKREYEYEDEKEYGMRESMREKLKDLIDKTESFLSFQESEEAIESGLDAQDHSSPSSTGFEIDREKKERSFIDEAGKATYAILAIEFFLVTYLVLALLGLVPMF